MTDPAPLEITSFQPHIGSTFTLSAADGGLALALLSVTPLGHQRIGARTAFSLIFRGPAAPRLPQRTYALTHAALGEQSIFLVPVSARDGALEYEAIFN